MKKYIVGIDGMMCGNCENHMNEAIRAAFSVEQVTSSHSDKQTVIVAESLDEEAVKKVVADTGYTFLSFQEEPYEKKSLFDKLKK